MSDFDKLPNEDQEVILKTLIAKIDEEIAQIESGQMATGNQEQVYETIGRRLLRHRELIGQKARFTLELASIKSDVSDAVKSYLGENQKSKGKEV